MTLPVKKHNAFDFFCLLHLQSERYRMQIKKKTYIQNRQNQPVTLFLVDGWTPIPCLPHKRRSFVVSIMRRPCLWLCQHLVSKLKTCALTFAPLSAFSLSFVFSSSFEADGASESAVCSVPMTESSLLSASLSESRN